MSLAYVRPAVNCNRLMLMMNTVTKPIYIFFFLFEVSKYFLVYFVQTLLRDHHSWSVS